MKICIFLRALATSVLAQQPAIDNAKLETRPFSGTLATQLSQLGARPFWAAYSEPIITGQHGDMCSWNRNGDNGRTPGAPVRLEGETALVVLIGIADGQPGELRVTSPDCHLDAGGLPFYWWLTNVPVPESLAWLKSQAAGPHSDTAIMTISLHQGAAADQALDDLSATTQPVEVRKRTAFWLGNSHGAHGIATLKRMLADDPSADVRDRVVFALSQSKDLAGIPLMIDAARNDKGPPPFAARGFSGWPSARHRRCRRMPFKMRSPTIRTRRFANAPSSRSRSCQTAEASRCSSSWPKPIAIRQCEKRR
jgi:hypothetical protein